MFEVDWRTPHLWKKTSPARVTAATLTGDRTTDVVVVGGGFTGLAAALAARESGADVILLEGDEIGAGASGRNNGLVISHHSKAAPSELEAVLGRVLGERYNRLVADSAATAFDLLRRLAVDAHQIQAGWIQPAHSPASLARGRRFHDEWKAFGADVAWLDAAEVTERVGASYLGGWVAHNSGHVNPFAMTIGLAAAIERQGVTIHENSRAERLEKLAGGWRVHTAGGSVAAREVVLATNALTGDLWPGLKRTLIPIKVFQAATDPLSAEQRSKILIGNPAVSDMRHSLRYFHLDRDNRLVSGGTHVFWFNDVERGTAKVSRMLGEAFPALGRGPRMTEYWQGVFAVTPDRKPQLYRLAPGLVFGGVYSGRGVALSLALGQEIGRWAAGRRSDSEMPLPVTVMKPVPFHRIAVQVANHMHGWHRVQDLVQRGWLD